MIRNFLRIQHTWLDNWRAKKKKKKGCPRRKNSQGQKQRDKNEIAMVKDQKVAQWLEE